MKKWILYIFSLLYPVWGTILTIYIAGQISGETGDYVVLGGLFGLFLSAFPLFKIKNTHVVMKIYLSICYFAVSSIIIFIVGWGAMCLLSRGCY